MPKANTTVKSVRIDNDKLEALEKMLDGKTINAWLNERIEEAVGLPSKSFRSTADFSGIPDGYKEKYEDLMGRYDKLSEAYGELLGKGEVNPKYDLPDEAMKDIEAMTTFCGMSLYDAMIEIDRLLNEGTLIISDEIKVVMPSWVTKIEEVCHDRCVSVDAFGKKVLDMIERGQI